MVTDSGLTRRDFAIGALAASIPTRVSAVQSRVRGVQIGLVTSSLTPLPNIPGRSSVDIVIEQCLRLGVRNVELGSRFFGPEVKDVVRGRAPEVPTENYLKSRAEQRRWRLSAASIREYAAVGLKFRRAGLNLFSISNTFFDDCTDAEIDAMFRQMRALGIKLFQTNQTRVPTGVRLAPAARKYRISPAFHPHAAVHDPSEVASPASLSRLLAVSPWFRVCLDIGHFVAGNNDPKAYLRNHYRKITHIHVKDRKRNQGPNMPWGQGDTPIKECLHLIRDNRWPIIALTEREYHGSGTPFEQTKANIEAMRRMLNA